MTIIQQKQAAARAELLKLINPDDTLLVVIKSISHSGMCRYMRVLTKDFRDISWLVADLCDLFIDETGLRVIGCGMDMTFWLVEFITNRLWTEEEMKTLPGLNGNGSIRNCLKWQVV